MTAEIFKRQADFARVLKRVLCPDQFSDRECELAAQVWVAYYDAVVGPEKSPPAWAEGRGRVT